VDLADPVEPPEPVETPSPPTANAAATTPTMVTLGDKLTDDERKQIATLVAEFSDVFSPINTSPALLPPFRIELVNGAVPYCCSPRPLTAAKRDFVRLEIERLRKLNIIQPSESARAAPIVVALKRNGQFRLCVDYKCLNDQTVRDAHPLPRVEDLSRAVASKPYLAALDMTMGYHQAPVNADTRPLLAFTTAFGLYEYTRLPFGVTNGPPYFQRVIADLFRDQAHVQTYLDDCAIAAATYDDFKTALRNVFRIAREHNLHFNPSKSVIGQKMLPYLGRLIGPTSIAIDPARIEALHTMQPPTSKKLLHTFLGFAQYHKQFIDQFATIAAPRWSIMKKDAVFRWEPLHEEAFQALKNAVINAPALAQPCTGAKQVLRTDASSYGIGGQLLQEDPTTQAAIALRRFLATHTSFHVPDTL